MAQAGGGHQNSLLCMLLRVAVVDMVRRAKSGVDWRKRRKGRGGAFVAFLHEYTVKAP